MRCEVTESASMRWPLLHVGCAEHDVMRCVEAVW